MLARGLNCHYRQKNAFFGQKIFFQKVNFIQNLLRTQNTVFHWVKNNFMLSNPKLVFFTRFYLIIKKTLLFPRVHDGQGAPQAGPVGEGQDGGQLGGVQRPVP